MLTHGNLVVERDGVGRGLRRTSGPATWPCRSCPCATSSSAWAALPDAPPRACTIAYAESVEQVPDEHGRGAAHDHVLGAAPLREDVRARAREGGAATRRCASGSSAGRWAWAARLPPPRRSGHGPAPLLRLQARASPTASSSRRSRSARAAGCACFVSGGAPLAARDRRSSSARPGSSSWRATASPETSPVIAVNRPDAMRPGSGRPARSTASRCKIAAGRRDPDPRPARDEGLLQQAGGHRARPSTPTAGSTPATSAHLDADGFLVITDRKKDIIVTSGGKNIAPQPIENRLEDEPAHRRGRDDRQPAQLPGRAGGAELRDAREVGAASRASPSRSREELVRAARGGRATTSRLIEELTADLAQFEKIKKIALLPREFTLEAGELTPTLKVQAARGGGRSTRT